MQAALQLDRLRVAPASCALDNAIRCLFFRALTAGCARRCTCNSCWAKRHGRPSTMVFDAQATRGLFELAYIVLICSFLAYHPHLPVVMLISTFVVLLYSLCRTVRAALLSFAALLYSHSFSFFFSHCSNRFLSCCCTHVCHVPWCTAVCRPFFCAARNSSFFLNG